MTTFEAAISVILRHEGGWNDVKADKGGETNFGISMKFIRAEGFTPADLGLDDFEPGCLKKLTLEKAKEIYKRCFWARGNYGLVKDQLVSTILLDCAINSGHWRTAVLAQTAVCSLGKTTGIDGHFGVNTANAINACSQTAFRKAFRDARERFYRDLVAKDATQRQFLKGWLKRAAWPDAPTPE